MVSNEGIHVDSTKIKVVKNWEIPKTPTDVRQFLGMTGYYQSFIENFSRIPKPLTTLTQKETKFIWGDKQEAAFQNLKKMLCIAPILSLPVGNDDFVVCCDASHQVVGFVLMNREKFVAYAS